MKSVSLEKPRTAGYVKIHWGAIVCEITITCRVISVALLIKRE